MPNFILSLKIDDSEILHMESDAWFDEIEIDEQTLKKQKLIEYLKKFEEYLEVQGDKEAMRDER